MSFTLASLSLRQLRQASGQGHNILGRSHENLVTSPRLSHHHHFLGRTQRKEPLRRYASANNLPFGNAASQPNIQYRGGSAANLASTTPVLRISGDFEDMWSRHNAASQHRPVYGRGTGVVCMWCQPLCIHHLCLPWSPSYLLCLGYLVYCSMSFEWPWTNTGWTHCYYYAWNLITLPIGFRKLDIHIVVVFPLLLSETSSRWGVFFS